MKKKMLTILLVFHCLLFIHGFAQNQISAEWLINSSGNGWSMISDQVTDEYGNVFITGYFNAEMGLGNRSERSQTNESVFVTKMNEKGGVVCMKKISSTEFCYSNSIISGCNGTLFIAGNFQGEINENGVSLSSPGTKNAFIIKFDTKGKIVWGTSINGSFRNKNLFISQDKDGNLIFAGSYHGELILDNHHYDSRYYCDIAIARLDQKTGQIIASQIMEGSFDDLVNDLIISPKGEIILTGSFEGDLIAGDKSLVSNGNKDVFLAVMDENLRFTSVVQMGGYYDDYGKSLAFDNKGNLLLAGSFAGSLRVGTNEILNSTGKLDIFLIKFGLTGKSLWSKSFGGGANDYINTLDINDSDEIYVTGSYRGMIETEGQKLRSEEFSTDIFLVKFGENGEFRFSESFGSNHDDFARGLCLDKSNNIYVIGNYSDRVEVLGAKAENSSGKNLFLAKLHDCSSVTPVRLPNDTTVCGEEFVLSVEDNYEHYFWNGLPGNKEFVINSTGWYTLEAIDKHGCISGDTIFVQLNKPAVIDSGRHFVLKESRGIIDNNTSLKTLSVEISPNPVKDKLTVKMDKIDTQSVLSLLIIAANGEKIWEESSMPSEVYHEKIINVLFIQPGTYILIIKNDKTTVKRIFVVI